MSQDRYEEAAALMPKLLKASHIQLALPVDTVFTTHYVLSCCPMWQ